MRLVYKLLLILLFASIAPVAVSSYFALRQSENRLSREASERHSQDARELARVVDQRLSSIRTTLDNQIQLFAGAFSRDRSVARSALYQIYQTDSQVDCVAVLDETGEEVKSSTIGGNPIPGLETLCKTESSRGEKMYAGHAVVPEPERTLFNAVAFELWKKRGQGLSRHPIYMSASRQSPVIAFAKPVAGDARKPWLVVVQVSLEELQNRIAAFSMVRSGGAFLFDDAFKVIAHPDGESVVKGRSVAELPAARECAPRRQFVLDGVEVLASCTRLVDPPWGVMVYQSIRTLFQSVRDMQAQTVFWVGAALVFAIGVAIFFARGISRPVGQLAIGAREVATGNFEHKIEVRSSDEIGVLGQTFNWMGAELKRSLEEIGRQNAEIKMFNAELQQRVDERTRELKAAQEQLLHSQKLAAVGELGAGVAHEINNPLAGVLGLAQLLLLKAKPEDPSYRSLKNIEKESLKIRDIVASLLRFSQREQGTGNAVVDVHRVLDDALSMVENQLVGQSIVVVREYTANVPRVSGDSAALQQAVLHIVTNAKNAMPRGGRLTLKTDTIDDKLVFMRIRDTGRGIAKENLERIFEPFFTTKDEWSGKGLGLSVAYRIVTEHKGRISVESEVGKGSMFSISLPAVVGRTQLV